jgi:hypothetical protein
LHWQDRSAIFCANDAQRRVAERYIAQINSAEIQTTFQARSIRVTDLMSRIQNRRTGRWRSGPSLERPTDADVSCRADSSK